MLTSGSDQLVTVAAAMLISWKSRMATTLRLVDELHSDWLVTARGEGGPYFSRPKQVLGNWGISRTRKGETASNRARVHCVGEGVSFYSLKQIWSHLLEIIILYCNNFSHIFLKISFSATEKVIDNFF